MKILIVASYNKDSFSPFIVEQANVLAKQGCVVDYFGIQGKGLLGYLRNYSTLRRRIKQYQPDIVHAHYGLSGLFANLQRKIPVVTTYHGSDINDKKVVLFSRFAMDLSAWNIFVSRRICEIAQPKRKYSICPCGIDLTDLQLTGRAEARMKLGLSKEKAYVLFSGAFDNTVKNYSLAKASVEELHDDGVELVELKGYSREEVILLMCAVDALLMTSFSEGSPQVIKEALACGCPIVSVDVGDVKERTEGVDGCFVASNYDAVELAGLLRQALSFVGKTKGRERIVSDGLDNRKVAENLVSIYKSIIA